VILLINPIVRRLVCLFLLVLLPLHSFAVQSGWYSSGTEAFNLAHEIDHVLGASHHHDDEHGSVHYDKSAASAEHFADYATTHSCAAIPPSVIPTAAVRASRTIDLEPQLYLPDPYPQRLHRPPSTLG